MSHLKAGTGWTWLKEGAGMLRKQPAGLATLLFAYILFSLAVGFIPYLGAIVTIVAVPCFSMAFMQACLLIDQGKRVTPDVLLTGFRQPAVKTLVRIGLVYLALFAVLAFFMPSAVTLEMLRQADQATSAADIPKISGTDMLGLMAVLLLRAVAVLTLSFTAPLAGWQNMNTGKALFYSFFAVLRARRAFFGLLVSAFVILMGVCFAVGLLLGATGAFKIAVMWLFCLFFLVLQCALYCAYRQIFGTPAAEPVSLAKN